MLKLLSADELLDANPETYASALYIPKHVSQFVVFHGHSVEGARECAEWLRITWGWILMPPMPIDIYLMFPRRSLENLFADFNPTPVS